MSGLDVFDVVGAGAEVGGGEPLGDVGCGGCVYGSVDVVGVGGALVGDGGCVGAVGAGDAGEGGFAVVGEVDGGGSGWCVGFVAGDLGVGEVDDEEQ